MVSIYSLARVILKSEGIKVLFKRAKNYKL